MFRSVGAALGGVRALAPPGFLASNNQHNPARYGGHRAPSREARGAPRRVALTDLLAAELIGQKADKIAAFFSAVGVEVAEERLRSI